MGETTQEQRSAYINDTGADGRPTIPALLARDADRLATIERRVRELVEEIREDAGKPDGNPARTYRTGFDNGYYSGRTKSANEIERLIDPPEDNP